LDNEGIELSRKAIEAVELQIAGVDVLIDKEGKKYILEVNHTPGMAGMEQATGKNIAKIYVEYALSHAK
jgi:ribosomal protein S6--L-glutamate ligase